MGWAWGSMLQTKPARSKGGTGRYRKLAVAFDRFRFVKLSAAVRVGGAIGTRLVPGRLRSGGCWVGLFETSQPGTN
jgi:hypothetical protein